MICVKKEKIIKIKLQEDYLLVGPRKIYVYYWKDARWLQIGHGKKMPTENDMEMEYKKLPISISYENHVTLNDNLNNVYEKMNLRSPMETPENKKWITKNLQPHPHISMSTGDIVRVRDEYWIVMPVGWKKLEFR